MMEVEGYAKEEKKRRMEIADLGWVGESPFHDGELQVQEKLGVMTKIDGFARKIVRRYMPEQHILFYQGLPFVVIGYGDRDGNPWCHLMIGEPGKVARAVDAVELDLKPSMIVPKLDLTTVSARTRLGLLGIDLAARRRNRLNATVLAIENGCIRLGVDQSFGNCPQYIARREARYMSSHQSVQEVRRAFGDEEKRLIENADTFFVASLVPNETGAHFGADASHRGGRPGFVRVIDKGTEARKATRLIVPEFAGNNHYNTYGNWKLYPRAGLLFIDFATRAAVSLTGKIELFLDVDHGPHKTQIQAFAGAERYWTFEVTQCISMPAGSVPLDFTPVPQDFMSPNSLLTGNWTEAKAELRAQELANEWRPYTVTKIVNENDFIKSFYLEAGDNSGLADFKPGQYLTIKLSSTLIRTYTISVAPREGYYRISVKREGKASTHLHDTISTGDTIYAKSPRGSFCLSLDDEKKQTMPAVLIGGGIGITPLLSMLRHTVRQGMRTRWSAVRTKTYFIHLSHDENTRAFFQESLQLAQEAHPEKVRVISLLSSVHGRLNKERLQEILPLDNYEFYICGPSAFTQAIYALLRQEFGIRDDRILAEAFGPSALERIPDNDTFNSLLLPATSPREVRFAKTDYDTLWDPDTSGTLLDLAEAHGIQPPYGCRIGSCASCLTKILKGSVTYLHPPVALADIEDSHCLLCQAIPAEHDGQLELDL